MKRERPLILSVIFWSLATSAPCVILAQSGRPVPAAPQGAGASIQPAQELAPGAIGPASVPPADSPIDQLLVNLEGQDPEKGTLAARDFLARAADEKSPNRNEYLTYLRQSLDPGRISAGGAPLRAAERLIGALGYTAESGQPLPPEGVEMVLCLVGAGPESFHKVVRDAIYSFARAETRGGTRDAAGESVRDRIVTALGGMLQVESPPPPGVREEIFGILWSLNGKELLRSLISALPRSRSGPGEPLNPYLVELRRRTALGFSSPDEWLRWWEANQGSSIEQILDGAHRQFRARNAELWSRTLRRIESAGDPEAYLGSITDALELDPTPELQLAAVEALARLCDCLRESKLASEGAATGESRKTAYTARGLALLLRLLDPPTSAVPPSGARTAGEAASIPTSPEVKRKALAALRGYASYLAQNPREEGAVSEVILTRLASAPPAAAGAESRADLLELARTAGALRVSAARPLLVRILAQEPPSPHADTELSLEIISALGRVLEREVGRDAVELILRYHRGYRDGPGRDAPEKARRDLRKACILALNVRIDDPELRREVRKFYNEVLCAPEDRPARVPAIIGLGILAQSGDRDAAADLAAVLSGRAQYEPAEAAAAVDALAYLNARDALEHLLPFLGAKDRPFADHLHRKVLNLIKGQGLVMFSWAIGQLEHLAFRQDQPELLKLVLELTEDTDLAALLSPDRANAANAKEFLSFWDAVLVRERAFEVSGDEPEATAAVALLSDLLVKDGRIKDLRPLAEEELSQARGRISRRVEAMKAMESGSAGSREGLAESLLAVVVPTEAVETRWRSLRWILRVLQSLSPSADNARLVDEVLAALSDPQAGGRAQAVWNAMLPEVRSRYLQSLESLRDSLRGGNSAATGN